MARPETVMSNESLSEGSIVLRLEFSIADAVYQRGLFSVIGAAVAAWWNRPKVPSNLPAHLRADVGLPPDPGIDPWRGLPGQSGIPPALWRPGM